MNPALRNLLITVVVIIVIGIGVFFWAHRAAAPTTTTSGQTATSTGVDVSYIGSSTPTVTESDITVTVPNYKQPIKFSSDTTPDVEAALNAQLATEQATLAKDPTNFDAWVNIGTIYKIAGDYQGAANVWTYVTEIYPQSSVGWEDVAGIYLDFVKNYPKAEADFKAAIAVNPTDDTAYESLVALYTTYGYGTTAEAKALVAAGLKANPSDAELLQLQAQLNGSTTAQ